ncbi:MAG TPA: hypothetical protein VGF40_13615 [Thermoanaerobaculia bacterium]
MRRIPILLLLPLLVACGGSESLEKEGRGSFKKGPISIRGWIAEIDLGIKKPDTVFSVTTPGATAGHYQRALFEETNFSVRDVPYASGGVADDGSFIILDAPPGRVTVDMQAPGVPLVPLVLENIPPNADVFIPSIKLYPDRFELLEPQRILVRVPSEAKQRKKAAAQAIVGGLRVDVWEVPLREMMDRRDWPTRD